jgi:hypothetical protein
MPAMMMMLGLVVLVDQACDNRNLMAARGHQCVSTAIAIAVADGNMEAAWRCSLMTFRRGTGCSSRSLRFHNHEPTAVPDKAVSLTQKLIKGAGTCH